MLFWFAFGAIFGVWNVFQSSGLDFRLIALGAVLPTLLDLPWLAQSYAHPASLPVSPATGTLATNVGAVPAATPATFQNWTTLWAESMTATSLSSGVSEMPWLQVVKEHVPPKFSVYSTLALPSVLSTWKPVRPVAAVKVRLSLELIVRGLTPPKSGAICPSSLPVTV